MSKEILQYEPPKPVRRPPTQNDKGALVVATIGWVLTSVGFLLRSAEYTFPVALLGFLTILLALRVIMREPLFDEPDWKRSMVAVIAWCLILAYVLCVVLGLIAVLAISKFG